MSQRMNVKIKTTKDCFIELEKCKQELIDVLYKEIFPKFEPIIECITNILNKL